MQILIAGGAGYVGSALIPTLISNGHLTDVVDLFWFGNNLPDEVRVLKKDIFDLQVKDLAGYEQVIFLAGLSNDPMAELSPAKNFIFNGAAPAYLAYIAKKARVRRYIYAGSCSVYGYCDGQYCDEHSPVNSSYPYGISKLQGEAAVMQLASAEFSVIALRKGTISGYSPRMRFDLLINTMFRSAMRDGVIWVSNPSIWRPFLSIEDTVAAYMRAVEVGESVSGIFNIASGNSTVGEVATTVKATLDGDLGRTVGLEIASTPDVRNYKVSIERAKAVLGFCPKDDVPSIVRNLLTHSSRCDDFDNPLYYNIRSFEKIEAGSIKSECQSDGVV